MKNTSEQILKVLELKQQLVEAVKILEDESKRNIALCENYEMSIHISRD